MVWHKSGSYHEADEHIFQVIKEQQKEVDEWAEKKPNKAEGVKTTNENTHFR